MASQEASYIQDTVKDNCVVVFSKTTCGYCRMAKKVFEDIGTPYVAVELNKRDDGGKMQSVLQAMTGESTVSTIL
uniref:Glutaredoxin domain-containing protein n=1 Tax=Capitella teleta TaxID=283909 RepID=X2B581_CAPTE